MVYTEQWKVLSSRIHGLMQAGQLHAIFLSSSSDDSFGRGNVLLEQCNNVLCEIENFKNQHQRVLPPIALASIERLDETKNRSVDLLNTKSGLRDEGSKAALVALVSFESEMTYILSDVQESIHSRSERAFLHLQRLIAVDEEFRKKWTAAFDKGEVECEKLGAVHLLWHGIWAFKINAAGQRTDLVFQEQPFNEAQPNVDGLILTEWKKANPEDNVENKFKEARTQAKLYTQGVLAGNELAHYRYAIVVSATQRKLPEDVREGDIIYRHINIAVNPLTPSKVTD